jgi:hypothetical protein
MYGMPGARSYRMPTPWRDATDPLKAEYCHLALPAFGSVYSFSLNLRPDSEAEARTKANTCTWLRDRIEDELRSGLGCAVQFMVAFEEDPFEVEKIRRGKKTWIIREQLRKVDGVFQPRLHAHGEMVVRADQVKAARRCLRRAGGEVPANKARQFQTHVKPNPDAGWVSYMFKTHWRMTPHMQERFASSRFFPPITFTGDVFSATQPLMQKAKELFERDRARLLRAR